MTGEANLSMLLKGMMPILNEGEFVFVTSSTSLGIDQREVIGEFREKEGVTTILKRQKADELQLTYDFITSWITLQVHSSLEAVGLTAAFSTELAKHNISCNVVAGFYHDHIFVASHEANQAMEVLRKLASQADNK